MLKTLADVAPSPAETAGPILVVLLGCLVVVAAIVVLVVYLVRRNRPR